MWAWAHEQPEETPRDVDASDVAAILVAHNGEQWLPRTLVALARLDAQPGRLVAVDAGSTDGSRALLEKGLKDGLLHAIVDGKAEEGFGANVQLALEAIEADGFEPSLLWFLHDDSAPGRHALRELILAIQTGNQDARPAIVVPKLLHPKRRNHPDQMSAVGESIAPSGARVLTVEPGDIDQHQLSPARVLGASTAGMLVTMDAWRKLGGFDPAVPLFRDGVDLGWRANAMGMAVRTCPKASMRHVEAGRVGLRDSVIAPNSDQADKAAGMSVVVMHSANPGRTIARLSAQSVLGALGYLLGKSPSLAAGQLRAASQLRRNQAQLKQTAARYTELKVDEVPAGLLPDRSWGVRRFFDRIAGAISDQYYDLTEDDDAGMIDELTGDDFAGGRRSTRILSPTIIGMLVMLVLSLVASRQLMQFGLLGGPALLPAPPTLADAWAGWAQSDPGMTGSNAPWLGLMALGATFALGQPDWWATLLVLGGPALAGWAAFGFLRQITGPGWWTPVLAALWGALLPIAGVTGRGSIDLVVLAIALPMLAGAVRRWRDSPISGAEGLRAPASVALLVGVLASSMPWTWLVGLLAALVMALRRRDLRGGLVAALGPLVFLGPWLPRLLSDPGRILTGADPALRVASNAPDAWDVLTGAAYLPAAPLWLALPAIGLLWIVGLLGALRANELESPQRIGLLAGAVAGPIVAVLMTRFVVTVAGVGVRPDPTGWLLIGWFCLLVLAAYGIGWRPERTVDDSPDDLARREKVIRVRTLLGSGLALALLASAAWWVLGATTPLSRTTEVLPTYVSGVQASQRQTRTLMVDLSVGTARYNLTSATSPAWGSAESPILTSDEFATGELRQAAQQFAQGQPSDDLAHRLASLGIAHVWLRGAGQEAITSLSSAPQLEMALVDAETAVFTVNSLPSRAMLRDGEIESSLREREVPRADADALIVLSEPVDDRWWAEIDGERLAPADSGDWRQAWATEGRTGQLSYGLGADLLTIIWQGLALVLLLILVAPTAQRSHSPRRALSSKSSVQGRSA